MIRRLSFRRPLLPLLYRALGGLLQKHGHASLALACYREAASANPADAQSAFLCGRLLLLQGDVEQAAVAFREALQARPDYAEAQNNLGIALYEQGQLNEAADCYRAVLRLQPGFSAAYNNLGNVQLSQGQLSEAEASFRQALRIDPDYAEAHNNLGTALKEQDRYEEAEQSLREALRLKPEYAGALSNLGGVLLGQQKKEEAVAAYREALRLQPDLGEAHANLAMVLVDMVQMARAVEYYEKNLRRNPHSPEAHNRLGGALQAQGRCDEAHQQFEAALEVKPDFAEAYINLGNNYVFGGNLEKALESYRKALSLAPNAQGNSSYAFYLNFSPDHNPAEVAAEYRKWASLYTSPVDPAPSFGNSREPERKLRLGYVSPDFRRHSVAYFIEPVIRHHDRSRVEVVCYSNVVTADEYTNRLKELADHWRDIRLKSDDQVCEMVQADSIDILVDLAGHTSGNRLTVFARRPAPVQVTYLGHPSTSGLDAIDYRITDALADPPSLTECYHSEQLIRLPRSFLTYAPPADAPEVADPPFARKGHITFGSFNNAAKINHRVVALWARILLAVPQSRLLLKNLAFHSASAKSRFMALFTAHGLESERIELLDFVPAIAGHLEAYREIDIALDTFPYDGTTTSCEALWMGVPVITLAGVSHVSRVGVSLLESVGLAEFIAKDADSYLALAVELAQESGRLPQLRSSLRDRLRRSPLTDAAGLTRDLENAYREMWHRWCARAGPVPAGTTQPKAAQTARRLHIGGTARAAGWEVLNANPAPYVDHVANANDLSRFPDDTFAEIYASHVVEHLDYVNELNAALKEWHRVLAPGGRVLISVPDLDVLAKLIVDKNNLTADERFAVMRMIFGGHVDKYDYHAVGLNEEFLTQFLSTAEFVNMIKVRDFGLFKDTSSMTFKGTAISLNMTAEKRETSDAPAQSDKES